MVTLTYPPGWQGQETVTFTVMDGLGRVASDQAVFTVSGVPVVGDIPDQTASFVPFDLDDYLLDGLPELITWTASGMVCLEVVIDPVTHVATVTNPGCSAPEDITFTAFVVPCEEIMSDRLCPGVSGSQPHDNDNEYHVLDSAPPIRGASRHARAPVVTTNPRSRPEGPQQRRAEKLGLAIQAVDPRQPA